MTTTYRGIPIVEMSSVLDSQSFDSLEDISNILNLERNVFVKLGMTTKALEKYRSLLLRPEELATLMSSNQTEK